MRRIAQTLDSAVSAFLTTALLMVTVVCLTTDQPSLETDSPTQYATTNINEIGVPTSRPAHWSGRHNSR